MHLRFIPYHSSRKLAGGPVASVYNPSARMAETGRSQNSLARQPS